MFYMHLKCARCAHLTVVYRNQYDELERRDKEMQRELEVEIESEWLYWLSFGMSGIQSSQCSKVR